MTAISGLNKNNSAVKRIMQEARELANDPSTDYSAAPLEDDIFEWHCTIRGPSGTEFEGGLYHFRIVLPSEYPFRPPSIIVLTPNGRFELNTKICISFTSYHEELWQPAWGVRTAIIGLQGFFPLKGKAAVGVGAIEYPTAERKRLAALSREWVCPRCKQSNLECLPDPQVTPSSSGSSSQTLGSSSQSSESTTSSNPLTDALATQKSSRDLRPSGPPQPEQRPPEASTHSVPLVAPTPTRPIRSLSIIAQNEPSTEVGKSRDPDSAPESDRQTPSAPENFQPMLAAALVQSPRRPPVLLDTAICVMFVLLCALIYRRLV